MDTAPSSTNAGTAPEPLGRIARHVWQQAWPTVLTMASYTVMQFVDSLMVAQVGPRQVAAQGNGGIWSFTPLAFLFGFLTVVNTFVSQSVGGGRRDAVARYAWAGIWLAVGAWLVVMVPWALLMPYAFQRMGHEPALVELESSYGRILAFGSLATLLGKALSNVFFGIQRPRVITLAAILGNVVNLVLNYLLIYGEAGLPRLGLPGIPGTPALGVAGAAVATVCGVAAETLLPAFVFLSRDFDRRWGIRAAWRPARRELLDLLRIGWPASVQFGNEIFCWAIFMTVLVGHFGSLHLTAGWAVLRYMHMSFMPAVGFSVATTSLVGHAMGAGQPELARRRAHVAIAMAMLYMAVCGLLMALLRTPMIRLFADGPATTPEEAAEIVRIGGRMMICAAVFQAFDAMGMVCIGALRGAGDTLFPGVATIVLSWGVIVGGGLLLVTLRPEWGSVGPWLAASAYIILLGLTMAVRLERGRWRSIRLIREV